MTTSMLHEEQVQKSMISCPGFESGVRESLRHMTGVQVIKRGNGRVRAWDDHRTDIDAQHRPSHHRSIPSHRTIDVTPLRVIRPSNTSYRRTNLVDHRLAATTITVILVIANFGFSARP